MLASSGLMLDPYSLFYSISRPLQRLCAASLNESEQHHIFRWASIGGQPAKLNIRKRELRALGPGGLVGTSIAVVILPKFS